MPIPRRRRQKQQEAPNYDWRDRAANQFKPQHRVSFRNNRADIANSSSSLKAVPKGVQKRLQYETRPIDKSLVRHALPWDRLIRFCTDTNRAAAADYLQLLER